LEHAVIGGKLIALWLCPRCDSEFENEYDAKNCCPLNYYHACSLCNARVTYLQSTSISALYCACNPQDADFPPASRNKLLENAGQLTINLESQN
jgi:hypothetical protein